MSEIIAKWKVNYISTSLIRVLISEFVVFLIVLDFQLQYWFQLQSMFLKMIYNNIFTSDITRLMPSGYNEWGL